jgi:hypothetical protein
MGMEEYQYFIEGTAKAPTIDFNLLTGDLILEGKSIPENAAKIYEPLLEAVNKYILTPRPETNFRLNLQYFNSASLIWFARITKAFGRIDLEDSVLFVHLYIEQEDFESFDAEEIRDIIWSIIDNVTEVKISVGVKIHTTDNNKIVKEATIFI